MVPSGQSLQQLSLDSAGAPAHFLRADSDVPAETMLVIVLTVVALALFALNRHRALTKIRGAERSFRDLYDNISEGVFRSTLDGRMISANPALVRLNGYESEAEMLKSVNDIAGEWYVDPNRRAELHQILLKSGKITNFVSEVFRHKTRERIWIDESTRLVRDERTGKPLYYDGTVHEVTETIRRLQLQDRYDKITSIMPACLYQHRLRPDGTSSIPYASAGLTQIFGIKPEEVADDASAVRALVHPDDVPRLMASFEHSAKTLTPRQTEYRVRTTAGVEKWVFGHSVPEREPDGSILWHGFLTDISERKRAEAKIYDLAYFDPLTSLPNRAKLLEGLGEVLSSSEQTRRWGALFFIDLDQFKTLNDTKGHHTGDRLLCEVATRLKSRIHGKEIVARLGGDEFVVILPDLGTRADHAADQVRRCGQDFLSTFREPFILNGFPFSTTASIGVALFFGTAISVDELLMRADLAMYEAKASGRGSLRLFELAMQKNLEEQLALSTELREALQQGALSLVYQPQVEGEGRCVGAEALLRWDHPQRGSIAPTVFLALAEANGFSEMIDAFVLTTACRTLRRWQEDPLTRDLRLSVNVSAHQLNGGGFTATVENALKEAGADPTLLALELTEHVMLDDMAVVSEVMLGLKALGVRFALDDFGTGYSSLSYLKQLPIDTLKIDQSFIRDLETDPSDRVIVQTILNIARNFQVSVIAEGVENGVQALLLRQLGCHAYQGHFFGRPMPLDEFESHVRTLRDRRAANEERRQLTA
jgi:diguanylate cyclase (GGDEF)-like protein/PAS domain S-box-containing protein